MVFLPHGSFVSIEGSIYQKLTVTPPKAERGTAFAGLVLVMTSLPPNSSTAGLRSDEAGSLSAVLISELIGSIVSTERSGDLLVESGASTRKVTFDRGFVVFASSNVDELRLGDLMLTSGRVTSSQLNHALEIVNRDNCRIGEALVQAGFLTQEEVDWELERQIRTISSSVYALSEREYRFDEHPCRIPEKLRLRVSAYRVQLEGIRNLPNGDLIEEALKPLERFVKTAETPPFSLQDVQLEPSEIRVSEAARTPASIEEIVRQIGEDSALGFRSVYGLLSSGVFELTDAPLAQPVAVEEYASHLKNDELVNSDARTKLSSASMAVTYCTIVP